MRLLVCGDVHWSEYSSIVRSRGQFYSTRLENLIQSVNWVERCSELYQCDGIIYLGDFFDKPTLTSEEITALNEIEWANKYHTFICGNHEMGINTLEFNSANIFATSELNHLIIKPETFYCEPADITFCYLPYVLENNRQNIDATFGYQLKPGTRAICFSHNDISGLQMGKYISTTGYQVDDITNHFNLYINGHIHNAVDMGTNKICNLGNITGQNFSEDASKYPHRIMLLDIDKTNISTTFVDNPNALNFYKLDFTEKRDKLIDKLKNNAIVSVTTNDAMFDKVKEEIRNKPNIIESRIIRNNFVEVAQEMKIELKQVDHLDEFQKYVVENIGNDETILEELSEVIK